MPSRKKFPFVSFNPHSVGLEKARALEWVIPNQLGGYAASNALGENTSRFHGLLVSGCVGLQRIVYLQALEEEINSRMLAPEVLNSFEFSYDSVSYYYKAKGVYARKQITPLAEKNAVVIHYSVENRSGEEAVFEVKPVLNSREHSRLTGEKISFTPRLFTDQLAGTSTEKGYMVLSASNGSMSMLEEEKRWKKIRHPAEDVEEYSYSPLQLTLEILPNAKEELSITVVAYPSEEETAKEFKELLSGQEPKARVLSSGQGASIFSLLNAADSFLVAAEQHKTIIAGYPSLGERGRDAMISLPGLTLINGRYHDAEKIFSRYLKYATYQGIPSGFLEGKPVYGDVDTSMWLIDRIYTYIKYVGLREGKAFLHTYWWTLKDMMANICESEREGILVHEGGTWMTSIPRKNAVEVQGLWYNALRIMEYFAELMEDPVGETYSSTCRRIEEKFTSEYWNGNYLSDCQGDDSLRPNQVLVLALDFNLVDGEKAKKIMSVVEKELLTPVGLRSLSSKDPGYDPSSPHNGGVWPWLLSAYIKAHSKAGGSRLRSRALIDSALEANIRQAGLGTMSEFLEGDAPHTPRGCISYSCSVAELLRAYFEDVMGKKPPSEKKFRP